MIETHNKIKNGTLRIENGRVIGLGLGGSESIDLSALDDLMDGLGRSGVASVTCSAISAIADIHSECCSADGCASNELAEFVNDRIRPIVKEIESHQLYQIVKTFSK